MLHHCGMQLPPVPSKVGFLFKTITINLRHKLLDVGTKPLRLWDKPGPRRNVCRKKNVYRILVLNIPLQTQNHTDFMKFYVCLPKKKPTIIQHDRILIRKYFENPNVLETISFLFVFKHLVLTLQRATIHDIANPSLCQASPTGKRNQLPWRHLPSVHR